MPSRVKLQSIWAHRLPASRRHAYPRYRGDIRTDVVIVGGGLTGCAIAYAFAAAGIKPVLLEEDRIASGASAASSGLLRPDPPASFREAARRYGLRDTRILWQTTRRASLDCAATLRRLGVRCDLSAADALTVARASREAERPLRREYDAQRDAGLEVSWLNAAALAREAAIDGGLAGIRTRDGAQMDPYRAALGFAAAALKRGAAIFEKSAARRIRVGRRQVEIRTEAGTIAAEAVVIATRYPPADLKGLRRHFTPELQYCVATEPLPPPIRRAVGKRAASIADTETPAHTLRWLKDDAVLFCGAAQPLLPDRSRAGAIEQRAWQLMYELSLVYPSISGVQPACAWDVEVARTVDGLPYIGTHRNYPRHLFALGIDPHRLGYAWLAARLLLHQFQGEPDKAGAPFGFARIL
jgi:glycine/D-amino acid oxidase-like deaminating enzyme